MTPEITEVAYYPIRPTPQGLIGFASCLYNGQLSLNSIALYTRPDGDLRLVFPDKVLPNGKVIQTYYPISTETYLVIKDAIKKKIEEVTKKVEGGDRHERNNKPHSNHDSRYRNTTNSQEARERI